MTITTFCGIGIGINLVPSRTIVKYETVTEVVEIEKECLVQNDCSSCEENLVDCFYQFNNRCEVCDDKSSEIYNYKVEVDNLLRSRDDCRQAESRLLQDLNTCKAKLPF